MNKKVKKTLAAGVLATSLLANGAAVKANVPEVEIDTTVEDENTVLARTANDWEKIIDEYTRFDHNPELDCNLDVQPIYDVVEVAEFIRDNYEYYTGEELSTISQNVIVDDVISYNDENNTRFSYAEAINAYNELNKEDADAVIAFLNKYAEFYPELNAHIRYSIIRILTAFRRDLPWYVRQDLENSDFLKEAGYDFAAQRKNGEYLGGEITGDLSEILFHYTDKDVTVNITAPNEGDETYGDGYLGILDVYGKLVTEAGLLGGYHYGDLSPEDEAYFADNEEYRTSGKTINGAEQTYEVKNDQEIDDLVREGIKIVEALSPATTYDFVSAYDAGIDVTALGMGHWFEPNENGEMFTVTYNEQTQKEEMYLIETFEMPTLTLTPEQEQVYRLK